jgi:hypothetical protein
MVHHTIIPTLGKLRELEHELQASLDYTARPCLRRKIAFFI